MSARFTDFEDEDIAIAFADAEAAVGEEPWRSWHELNDEHRQLLIDIIARMRSYLIGGE
jgi:hypothetical protein